MGAIRFTLALSVAVWHLPGAPFKLLNAAVAVLAFFIISGFYMAMVLTEKYSTAKPFYAGRFLRLYPAYATVATFMVFWFVLTNSPTAFTTRCRSRSQLKRCSPSSMSLWWARIFTSSHEMPLGRAIFSTRNGC